MQGALPGLATQFPPEYMGALGQGNVIAGIITSTLNIISISNMDADNNASPSSSAFYYFLVAFQSCNFKSVSTFNLNATYYGYQCP